MTDFALITDRTASDVRLVSQLIEKNHGMTDDEMILWLEGLKGAYNASDLNRVENAVLYVLDRLKTAGWYLSAETKTDWSMSDYPTESEMRRYLDNIRLLRSALPTDVPDAPADMSKLTYEEANTIERILVLLDAAVANIMQNVYYSNEIYSGEVT